MVQIKQNLYLKRWLRLHIRNMQNNSVSIRCLPPYCLDWFQHLNYTYISRTHSAITQCYGCKFLLHVNYCRYVFNIMRASEMIHRTNNAYTPWNAHKSLLFVMFLLYIFFSKPVSIALFSYKFSRVLRVCVYKLGYWEPQSANSKMFAHVFRRYMVLQINTHTLTKDFYPTNANYYILRSLYASKQSNLLLYTCTVKVKTII